jgi:drug/metabolite transporter (DMT)-like permease
LRALRIPIRFLELTAIAHRSRRSASARDASAFDAAAYLGEHHRSCDDARDARDAHAGDALMPAVIDQLRIFALTTATMIAFAANSLLCRAALRGGAIDAASFTAIRLASGALVLVAITQVLGQARSDATDAHRGAGTRRAGSWPSAFALAAYAVAFSYAYLRIGAGIGALLLFGSVQLTMITGGLIRGERPTLRQWVGFAVAASGMILLNLPGLDPPPLDGAALMLASGVAWGIYSLRGRGAARPILTTAGNFLRSVPIAALLAVIAIATSAHLTAPGIVLALASGGIASGLGYCLWYAVLPSLGAARAAFVQLSVPVIAAVGAAALLDEPLRRHVALGGAVILGGLALALWRPAARPQAPPQTRAHQAP